jgi:hypothetical protein
MLCEGTIEERKHAQLEFKGDISSHIIDGNVRDSGELMSEVMSLKSHAQSVLDPDGTSEIS